MKEERTMTTKAPARTLKRQNYFQRLGRNIVSRKGIYLMLIPGALYYLVFKFLPVLNLKIVFQVYSPTLQQQERVSWQALLLMNFTSFFSNVWFWKLLRNTLILALLNITFHFPSSWRFCSTRSSIWASSASASRCCICPTS